MENKYITITETAKRTVITCSACDHRMVTAKHKAADLLARHLIEPIHTLRVKQIEQQDIVEAVAYHDTPVVEPSNTMEFKGGASIKTVGGTFTAKANAYGNWYGYQGSKRVTMFFGDYVDQMFEAAQWLKTLEQAAALKGSR
jgi:hypothetical protein